MKTISCLEGSCKWELGAGAARRGNTVLSFLAPVMDESLEGGEIDLLLILWKIYTPSIEHNLWGSEWHNTILMSRGMTSSSAPLCRFIQTAIDLISCSQNGGTYLTNHGWVPHLEVCPCNISSHYCTIHCTALTSRTGVRANQCLQRKEINEIRTGIMPLIKSASKRITSIQSWRFPSIDAGMNGIQASPFITLFRRGTPQPVWFTGLWYTLLCRVVEPLFSSSEPLFCL